LDEQAQASAKIQFAGSNHSVDDGSHYVHCIFGKVDVAPFQAEHHPGGVQTELSRHMGADATQKLVDQINQQVAATSVWTAVVGSVDEVGGQHCENCHVRKIVPDDVTITAVSEGVRRYALDPKNAEALWKKSEEMVGESF
jgi:hypothetical protein